VSIIEAMANEGSNGMLGANDMSLTKMNATCDNSVFEIGTEFEGAPLQVSYPNHLTSETCALT